MKISRTALLFTTTYAWIVFVLLSWQNSNPYGLLNIVGFILLTTLFGLLTMFGISLGKPLPFWHRFGQIIGLSILEIFVWPLICNILLPYFHIARPLDHRPLLIELSVLYSGLAIWSFIKLKGYAFRLPKRLLFKSSLDVMLLVTPLTFILLAIGGANSLNNGGTDTLTLIMLGGIACYLGALLLLRDKLQDNTVAWAIYMISLSLLFMTSLRGWFITGHDIQHEFQVFQLTKNEGIWRMINQKDPYNACLSITILPTVFSNVLHVDDPYIYKVFFQMIFASVPAILYIFNRRYLSRAKAILAVIFFIGFPTFYTDMPFLNRQEIAFLFLSLMLLVIFDDRIKIKRKQWLFIAFGLGMILAHYSTTYSVLLLLFFAMCARPIFYWIASKVNKNPLFAQSSISILNGSRKRFIPFITVPMVTMLLYFCFIWFMVITNTATGASNILVQTIDGIKNGLNADSRSNDVSYSIFSPSVASPKQQLKDYVNKVVDPQRAQASKNTFYSDSEVNRYPVKIANQYVLPPTKLGAFLSDNKINISSLNSVIKQSSAKLLQLFVAIGIVYVLFRKRYNSAIEPELYLLAGSSLLFVFLQVVLPNLSQSYGILRAFQQSLMVLGMLLVVGIFVFSSIFKKTWLKIFIPSAIAILFFLTSTGFVSQLLGGYQAQLFLNNSGQYYDVYYTHAQELAGINWLNSLTQENIYGRSAHAVLQTDEFDASKLSAYTKLNTVNDVYPGIVETYSYVYLGYFNVHQKQAAIFYNGDLINYTYPTQFLNQNKNLIYSNGGAEIYK